MTPPDAQHAYDQRFATDLEVADAQAAPSRSADSLVVHGMLSMIAPDEPARLEARIGRAIAAVHAESARTSPIARIGHSAAGLGASHALRSHHASWRRRIALAGGGIGIAAVLGFAVLFTPSGQSQSGSQAYAALDSIRAAAANADGRTYRVRIERGPAADAPRDPRRGEMREPGHPWRDAGRDPAEPRRDRMREPGRDALRDAMREGELVLGPGRRYVLAWRIPGKPAGLRMGFDGDTYWAILPDGTIRTADSPVALRIPPLFMAADPAPQDDGEGEQLTLDAILTRLERGYDVTFANGIAGSPVAHSEAPAGARSAVPATTPPTGSTLVSIADGAAPTIEVLATRRGGPRGRGPRPDAPPEGAPPRRGPRPDLPEPTHHRPPPPGPDSVRIVADATTFDVQLLRAEWSAGPMRSMTIERVASADATPLDAAWFSAEFQRNHLGGPPTQDR
ncbi:MAG: hypothetical protein FGM37_00790 [Phycisphaerales bacterium]|nr:hypothetical protein [Phycisphaerales bacterium]